VAACCISKEFCVQIQEMDQATGENDLLTALSKKVKQIQNALVLKS
jgi:hypothetical protein